MSWWEIALLTYFILTPFSQIVTIALIMTACEEYRYRKHGRI